MIASIEWPFKGPIAFGRFLLLIFIGVTFISNTNADELSSVITAWKNRQASVKSLQFSWSGTEFAAEGIRRGTEPGAILPKDYHFDYRMSFTIDRDRIRKEYHGKGWSVDKVAYVPKTVINIFNNQEEITSFPIASGGNSFPSFFISKKSTSTVGRGLKAKAIRITYRPFDAKIEQFDQSKFEMTEEEGVVDGRRCLVLWHKGKNSGVSVWVDPSRDFIPLRYYESRWGMPTTEVQVSYLKDGQHGWVPKSWKISCLEDTGRVSQSWSGTVDSWSLNERIPDSAFKVAPVVGSWVRDYRNDETYILLEGGKRRPILKGEFDGTNYEYLRNSDPPVR